MKLKVIMTYAVMFPGILFYTKAFAMDDLYLCGVTKEINTKTAMVIVDVASQSCRGLRTFRLPVAKGGAAFNVDERRCFFIDSNSCQAGHIQTITKTATE